MSKHKESNQETNTENNKESIKDDHDVETEGLGEQDKNYLPSDGKLTVIEVLNITVSLQHACEQNEVPSDKVDGLFQRIFKLTAKGIVGVQVVTLIRKLVGVINAWINEENEH